MTQPFEGNALLPLIDRLGTIFVDKGELGYQGSYWAVRTVTANYSAQGTDCTIIVSCSSANITVSLPAAASHTGKIYAIVKTDSTAYAAIIDPAGAETIGGQSTFGLNGRNSATIVQSDGTGWYFLSRPRDFVVTQVSANYSVAQFDGTVECTANSFTVTLPTAVAYLGRTIHVKNSGNGVITIATTSSQTIDGNASGVLKLVQYDNLTVQSNGANWIIL